MYVIIIRVLQHFSKWAYLFMLPKRIINRPLPDTAILHKITLPKHWWYCHWLVVTRDTFSSLLFGSIVKNHRNRHWKSLRDYLYLGLEQCKNATDEERLERMTMIINPNDSQ